MKNFALFRECYPLSRFSFVGHLHHLVFAGPIGANHFNIAGNVIDNYAYKLLHGALLSILFGPQYGDNQPQSQNDRHQVADHPQHRKPEQIRPDACCHDHGGADDDGTGDNSDG